MKPKQKLKPQAPSRAVKVPSRDGTFADHITELRRRLVWVAAAFMAGSSLAYSFHDVLVNVIMSPLNGQKLVYLTPGGGFSFIFQISIYAGLIFAAPVIVHHVYAFIKPALPSQARRSASKVVLAAIALIIAGISYGYFVAVPAALKFLSGFAGDTVTPNLTADSYLSFFLSYIAGLAVMSLLPLVLVFWHWISPLTPGGLLKSERWVIVLAFVAAAIITPTPDAANQAMIAGPVILLYQFGIASVLLSIASSKRRRKLNATDTNADIILSDDTFEELLNGWFEDVKTPQLDTISEPAIETNRSQSRKITIASQSATTPTENTTLQNTTSLVTTTRPPQYARPSHMALHQRQTASVTTPSRSRRYAMDVIPQPSSQRPTEHNFRSVRPSLNLDGVFAAPLQPA